MSTVPAESDKWPNEPDEPDPESRWGNPEEELVSIPSVESPAAVDSGEPGAGVEIDSEVAKLFWVSVIYANVALGGVAIGLLLVLFRGQWRVGGGAVAIGCFALYRTYDIYRTYQTEVAGESDESAGSDDPTDDTTTESTEVADRGATETIHE